MQNLQPNLILQRATDIEIVINSNNIEISTKNSKINCEEFALPILDTFSCPISVSAALKKLESRLTGFEDWVTLTSTITHLYNSGILVDETQQVNLALSSSKGFGGALLHTLMLNDRVRTSAYLTALREVVRPGDIVVDIGTGTGILAIGAIRAGAKHVYAIEATGIGKTAEALFEANGLADQITLLPGWSNQITLPEKADVLVSEIIGHEPLGENVLETTIDACERLLKKEARLIPRKLKIFGLPLTIPEIELSKRTFTKERLESWETFYEINFNPLKKMLQDNSHNFFIKPQKASKWLNISEPILLADIDFKTQKQAKIDNMVEGVAKVSGELNGLLIYFELELGSNTILSTHPARVDKNNHWFSSVHILSDVLNLQVGDKFKVHYRYRIFGVNDNIQVSRS